jgi:hypothetical protein
MTHSVSAVAISLYLPPIRVAAAFRGPEYVVATGVTIIVEGEQMPLEIESISLKRAIHFSRVRHLA